MAGALEGVHVLDCSHIIAGPLAATLLSEMGADVVKLEPLEGEPWRLQAEILPKESRIFLMQNRGKRGITLDLKRAAAAPVREKLVRWADVVLTNYRPDVARTLHLDYDSLRKARPDIIACNVSAFGDRGPDAPLRGYDIIAQGMSGLATMDPIIRDGLPVPVPYAPADVATGLALAWAITAALCHRERTGVGQRIDASLLLSSLFMQPGFQTIVAMDEEPQQRWLQQLAALRERGASITEIAAAKTKMAPELLGNIYYRFYQTKDGYISVGCLGPGPRARLCGALGIRDPRFEPGFDYSPENLRRVGAELVVRCEAIFRDRTNEEWMEHLTAEGVPCGPLRYVEEMPDDPQVLENGYETEYEHLLLGTIRGPAPIVQMSATPTRVQRGSPALGQHTDEVLQQLGIDEGEIATLRRQGVIG